MYPSSEPIDLSVLRLVQGKSLVRIVDDDETVANPMNLCFVVPAGTAGSLIVRKITLLLKTFKSVV